jgi:hypothetical protein
MFWVFYAVSKPLRPACPFVVLSYVFGVSDLLVVVPLPDQLSLQIQLLAGSKNTPVRYTSFFPIHAMLSLQLIVLADPIKHL